MQTFAGARRQSPWVHPPSGGLSAVLPKAACTPPVLRQAATIVTQEHSPRPKTCANYALFDALARRNFLASLLAVLAGNFVGTVEAARAVLGVAAAAAAALAVLVVSLGGGARRRRA